METAKEELQSSNEELKTLNDEVKNRNQTLAQLNDDLTNLNKNVDSVIVIVDKDLKIRLFSPSAQKVLSLSPSTVGLPITTIKLGVTIENLEETLSQVLSKLGGISQEVTDSQGHYFDMRIRPYITQDDRIGGAVLSFSDITERKTHNEREIESLAKFPFENPNPVFRIKANGKILYANPAGDHLLAEWKSKVGERAPKHVGQVLTEAFTSNKKIELEEMYGLNIFSFLFVPIISEGYVNIYAKDITGRKKAEAQIVEQLQMLDLAHVLVRNMRDEIIFWNLGAQTMYGFSKEQALGKSPRELLKTVFPKPFEQIKKELLRTGKWEGELIHRKADGSIIYVASYWVLHNDGNGKPAAIIEVNNDITELKKAEEKLEDYRRNLEKLVEERTKKLEVSSLYARKLIEASLTP